MKCEFCTGSAYLSDRPEWGPCLCVTPQNMSDLRAMYADAERELQEAYDGQTQAIAAGVAEQKTAADHYASLIAEARDHLQRYFQRVHGASRPIRGADPDLDAIADAILYEPLEVT